MPLPRVLPAMYTSLHRFQDHDVDCCGAILHVLDAGDGDWCPICREAFGVHPGILTFTCCDQSMHADCFLHAIVANPGLSKRCFNCRARRTVAREIRTVIPDLYEICRSDRTPQPIAMVYRIGVNARMAAAAARRASDLAESLASSASTAVEDPDVVLANDVSSRQASSSSLATSESTNTTSTTNTSTSQPPAPSSPPPPPYSLTVTLQPAIEAPDVEAPTASIHMRWNPFPNLASTSRNILRRRNSHPEFSDAIRPPVRRVHIPVLHPVRPNHFTNVEYLVGVELHPPAYDTLQPLPVGISTFVHRDYTITYTPSLSPSDPPRLVYCPAAHRREPRVPPPRVPLAPLPDEPDDLDAGSRFSVLPVALAGIDGVVSGYDSVVARYERAQEAMRQYERRFSEAVDRNMARLGARLWGNRFRRDVLERDRIEEEARSLFEWEATRGLRHRH